MLTIRTLESTSMSEIANTFNRAFSDYFVPFQVDQHYLYGRWKAARVDYSLSVGAFEEDELVGFIIFGVDSVGGVMTAHNAATGVVPECRGRRLVAMMYQTALPLLRRAGVKRSTLEVITENDKAIKAYAAAGYSVCRTLLCFAGSLTSSMGSAHEVQRSESVFVDTPEGFSVYPQTWELSDEALRIAANDYECWYIAQEGDLTAFAVFNSATGFVARLGFADGVMEAYGPSLLAHIGAVAGHVKINNVDDTATELVSLLRNLGLKNPINQYEMYMKLESSGAAAD